MVARIAEAISLGGRGVSLLDVVKAFCQEQDAQKKAVR
jgi:hypothetical protein